MIFRYYPEIHFTPIVEIKIHKKILDKKTPTAWEFQ